MFRVSQIPIFFTILAILVGYVSCAGFYTIVAPKNIRPNSDYQVSITLHDKPEPAKIRLSIEDGIKYKNTKDVTIETNKTEMISLPIGDLDVNKGYKFIAEGLSGIIFKNESSLFVESKNVSIFIQTDKAIYKPGETIKFRVLVLDFKLRPATLTNDKLLNVYLNDPEKNRIKQWMNVIPRKGVFSNEIQLSELPTLGDWTFTAEVQNEKKSHRVKISEYVLPKFEVTIDSPNDFSAKDGKIRAIIRSKYTYGKMVKGEAIVSMTPVKHYYLSASNRDSIIKTVPIDGKGTVEFDVDNDLRLTFSEYSKEIRYELRATVVEELTGLNQTTIKRIVVHENRYRFHSNSKSSEFNPGIPKTFELTITHHDNSPILLNEETKFVTVGKIVSRFSLQENVTYYQFEVNANGTANIRIPTSVKDPHFHLQVKYMGEESDLGSFHPVIVSEPSELEIKVLNKRITLNKDVFCEIQSSDLLKNFTYQVVAHGKIIYAENVEVPDRNYHVFKFMATFDLVPTASIIAYRFKNDGIISTNTGITIEEDLNNFIKLKLSKTEVRPGQEVNIDVITKAGSYVGLAGVDQSVLLLKGNNDLTRDEAVNEMNQYHYNFYDIGAGPWSVEARNYIDNYFNSFENSRVVLFTNAKQSLYRFEDRYYAPLSAVHRKQMQVQEAQSGPIFLMNSAYPESSSALSGPSVGDGPAMPPKIRTEFPETWLWEDFDIENANGSKTLVRNVPDTITSWVITGFSVDPKTGLGLTKSPKTLNVFQPFFVSLNLPYSVKRGEVVSIPVVVFNYLASDVETELTIHNDNGDFEFIDDNQNEKLIRKRKLTIASNNGVNTNFIVKFNKVGHIPIKVTATSAISGDAIERLLLVEPEGVPQFINKAIFVDLREFNEFEAMQNIDVPEIAIEGSLNVAITALGDLLGGTIQNLQQLIRLPTGCGEQNMLKFVPNILVLDYLKVAEMLQPAIESKAIKYLISGYQRELTYRHANGSFSAFGKWDRKGSVWLTAFVAKSFKQAEKYIDIDAKIIDGALSWLATIQQNNGSFIEFGTVYHTAMQGGSAEGIALTAYTAIAFLRNKQGAKEWKYQKTVDKAMNYIANQIKNIDEIYAKSIAAYVLQIADHPMKDDVLDDLVGSTIAKDQHKWWAQSSQPNAIQSKSINIEMTSYGVLALIEAKRLAEALPYFKWLLAQRNDKGGFVGTQDTVIGLEAISKYAEHLSTKNNNVQMKVELNVPFNETFINVNRENALVLQSIDLPIQTRTVKMHATGHGFALFQLSYRYNLLEKDIPAVFDMNVKLSDFKPGHLTVEVCSSYKEEKPSNMVILEVGVPTGFRIEKEKLASQLHVEHVKLVETKHGETVANIYFEQMIPNEKICVEVQGYRSHKVAENKPVVVRLYDYYDSSKSSEDFYEIPSISSCDICQGEECSKSCKKSK